MVEQLGRGGALRLAHVRIALEVVGERREAHREVVAVAQPHAQRPVGRKRQVAELIGAAAWTFAFLAPQGGERIAGRIAPAGLLVVLRSAVVARQLANDVVLVGAPLARAHDLAALGFEVGQPLPGVVRLVGELHAALGAAQGARKQELVVAIGAVELHLRDR